MNRAAERLGQTLFNMVSTVIEDTGLNWSYWPKLILATNYLRNRSLVIGRKLTPYKATTGYKLRISHLRYLSTPGYTTLRKPAGGWKKGQERARKGVLIGYEGDYIYRLLMPNSSITRSIKVL